jgi:hypothetical protein
MMRGKAFVDELPQVFPDRLASMPVGDAEIAYGILCETIKALPEGNAVVGGFADTPSVLAKPPPALARSRPWPRRLHLPMESLALGTLRGFCG